VLLVGDVTRRHLFVCDAADAGCLNLTDNRPGLTEVRPLPLAAFAGEAWFSGLDSRNQLWRSDGTRPGTVAAGINFRDVSEFLPALGGLAIVGSTGGSNRALAITNGTDAGTRIVHGVGAQQSNATRVLGVTSTHVFFIASSQLWATDGTSTATAQLAPFAPASSAVSGARSFFSGANGAPFVSDGTTAGTLELSSMATQAESFTAITGGRVVFFTSTTAEGLEPWVSDGAVAGTSQTATLVQGSWGWRFVSRRSRGRWHARLVRVPGAGGPVLRHGWNRDGHASRYAASHWLSSFEHSVADGRGR
jgi:ELWxxDGT repeat protein